MEAEPFFFNHLFLTQVRVLTLRRQIKITNIINQLKKYIF